MNNIETIQQVINVSGFDYQIRSLKDFEQYSDPLGHAEQLGISQEAWHQFGMLGPSEILLAKLISSLELKNIRVLEIGCGIGLASMVASNIGALVTASDYHPMTEEFLQRNVRNNLLPKITYIRGDWRTPITSAGRFDLIIGSDLLYKKTHSHLVSTFIDCHAKQKAKVIIIEPEIKNSKRFVKMMKGLGFCNVVQHIKSNNNYSKKEVKTINYFERN